MWYLLHQFYTELELGVAYTIIATASSLSGVAGGPIAAGPPPLHSLDMPSPLICHYPHHLPTKKAFAHLDFAAAHPRVQFNIPLKRVGCLRCRIARAGWQIAPAWLAGASFYSPLRPIAGAGNQGLDKWDGGGRGGGQDQSCHLHDGVQSQF